MGFYNLRLVLSWRRMRQHELAKSCGLSESFVSRALSGFVQFRPETKEQIAALLGVEAGWLFSEPSIPASVLSPSCEPAEGRPTLPGTRVAR